MKLTTSFLVALILSVIGIVSWELFWRSQDYEPTLDDNKHLWANERAKVEKLSNTMVLNVVWAILFFLICIAQGSGEQFIYFQF